jgi:hypothetical protein
MGKKILLTLAITFLLVLSLFSFFQVVKLAKAVPTIPPDTVWHIEQPKNASYDTNYVAINFTVETNLGLLYYYSLDGQEKQEIGTKTISTVPLPEYPPFIDGSLWTRRTFQAVPTQLPYLSKGNHTLTIYQIYPRSIEEPEKGNIVSQALMNFEITSSLPEGSPPPLTNPSTSPQLINQSKTPNSIFSDYWLNQTFFGVIVILIFIGVLSLLVVVYHKKRKGNVVKNH